MVVWCNVIGFALFVTYIMPEKKKREETFPISALVQKGMSGHEEGDILSPLTTCLAPGHYVRYLGLDKLGNFHEEHVFTIDLPNIEPKKRQRKKKKNRRRNRSYTI